MSLMPKKLKTISKVFREEAKDEFEDAVLAIKDNLSDPISWIIASLIGTMIYAWPTDERMEQRINDKIQQQKEQAALIAQHVQCPRPEK
ncbi:MAG: hypothetical protein ACI9SP_000746 [Arenicella sp.]|jgi:hypothetical protein